jgi:hypothetical protein
MARFRINPKKKIDPNLSNRRRPIGNIIEPFFLDENDPKFHTDKTDPRNSTKVLTIKKRERILKLVTKRKDGRMTTKSKQSISYMQMAGVGILAAGATLGFVDLLGGSLQACVVVSILIVCLLVIIADWRK